MVLCWVEQVNKSPMKKRTFAAIWSHKAMSGVLSIIKGSDLLSLYLVGHASSYWPIATGVHIYLDLLS